MRTLQSLLVIAMLTLLAWNCKDDDNGSVDKNANAYEACCGIEGIEKIIGQAHVYIQNIITPNFDGKNDGFLIYSDENVEMIESLTIKDKDGKEVFVYYNFPPNEFQFSWNPEETEAPGGMYDYVTVIQSTDGVVDTINGSVCVYRCKTETDSILTENRPKCQFGSQHDGAGGFDKFAATQESDICF